VNSQSPQAGQAFKDVSREGASIVVGNVPVSIFIRYRPTNVGIHMNTERENNLYYTS
jgi:hypothetical protein